MDIDRMLFLETYDGINYSGELCNDEIYKSGIIIRPSGQSEVKIWVPLERIKCIFFPDRSKIDKDESNFSGLFQHMRDVKKNKRSTREDE